MVRNSYLSYLHVQCTFSLQTTPEQSTIHMRVCVSKTQNALCSEIQVICLSF